METENQNEEEKGTEEQSGATNQISAITMSGDLSPLTIIRTEDTLSRFPVHNLAKKGNVTIHIVKKTPKGEVNLKWEVSHNSTYGQPRQLAYKLDTIIINRTIEEAGRPVPKIIRLGSLNELSKKLGSERNELKRALQQNATTAINAKVEYRDINGGSQKLEALFTRYSVYFAGKQLPDGRKADAVYLVLNDPYWEVLNNSQVRPLDYDYLKELPPAAQRFYEIISRKMFVALKYDHPHAKLPYSEYCTYSAQQRYFDYNHFKKQMYKVHRPHVQSGYIAEVRYEMSTDEENKPDWIMLYTPGEKARAEFRTFSGLPPIRSRRRRKASSEEDSVRAQPAPALSPSQPGGEKLLAELIERGVYQPVAEKFLSSLSPEKSERITDCIDYWDSIQGEKGAGLLIHLLQGNDPLPSSFETRRQREDRLAAEERRLKLQNVKTILEEAYDEYRRGVVDRFIAEQLTAEEFDRRVAAHRQSSAQQTELWSAKLRPKLADDLARQAVRSEIGKQVNTLPFEEFRRRELPRILSELRLDPAELGIELPARPPVGAGE
jgi:hypothetical protein